MAVANTFTSMKPMFKESYAGSSKSGGGGAYAAKRMKEVAREKPKFKRLTTMLRGKNGTR